MALSFTSCFGIFVVDTDYAGLHINLYESPTYNYRGAGQSIPLKVQPDGAIYVEAILELARRRSIQGEFVVDTGGNSTLMLARNFVQQNRVLESVGQTIQAGGGGVGGPIQIELAVSRASSWGVLKSTTRSQAGPKLVRSQTPASQGISEANACADSESVSTTRARE